MLHKGNEMGVKDVGDTVMFKDFELETELRFLSLTSVTNNNVAD